MILSVAIASVFSFSSLINTTTDLFGSMYDKQVIQESVSNMADTAYVLKEKAEKETDPAKKAIKLKMAEKLKVSSEKIHSAIKGDESNSVRKTAFSTGKALLGEASSHLASEYIGKAAIKEIGHYGAYMASKTIAAPAAIVDGILENIISAKKLLYPSKYDDIKTFKLTTGADDLDLEIEKIKAAQLLKEGQDLNDELEEMRKFYDSRDEDSVDSAEETESPQIEEVSPSQVEEVSPSQVEEVSPSQVEEVINDDYPYDADNSVDEDWDPYENLDYMPSEIPYDSYNDEVSPPQVEEVINDDYPYDADNSVDEDWDPYENLNYMPSEIPYDSYNDREEPKDNYIEVPETPEVPSPSDTSNNECSSPALCGLDVDF